MSNKQFAVSLCRLAPLIVHEEWLKKKPRPSRPNITPDPFADYVVSQVFSPAAKTVVHAAVSAILTHTRQSVDDDND